MASVKGVLREELNEFADVPLILQVVATLIILSVCIYESTYARRARKRDSKERFEEYRKRYKWS